MLDHYESAFIHQEVLGGRYSFSLFVNNLEFDTFPASLTQSRKDRGSGDDRGTVMNVCNPFMSGGVTASLRGGDSELASLINTTNGPAAENGRCHYVRSKV